MDIHRNVDHPTNVTLPRVDPDEPIGAAPEGCRIPNGFTCDEPLTNPAEQAVTGISLEDLDGTNVVCDAGLKAPSGVQRGTGGWR